MKLGHFVFLSLHLSVVVSFSVVGPFSTNPIMVVMMIIILLFVSLLTRSRNWSDDYYYIFIYSSTYVIASFFHSEITSLIMCVFHNCIKISLTFIAVKWGS